MGWFSAHPRLLSLSRVLAGCPSCLLWPQSWVWWEQESLLPGCLPWLVPGPGYVRHNICSPTGPGLASFYCRTDHTLRSPSLGQGAIIGDILGEVTPEQSLNWGLRAT